jgi:GTP-binding protein YchF
MDLAIVGLPQAGKTTVFTALTAGHGSAGGDSRGEHIGVVKIPDARLEKLAVLVQARKVTPVELRLHDLPPLFQRGAPLSVEAGESLSKADALVHVVRAFHRDDVPHPQGSVDPHRDIAAFEAELMLNDLGIVERRIEKLDITVRSARPGEREAGERETALLQRVRGRLESETPPRGAIADPQDLKALANFGLLSLKPMLILLNADEREAAQTPELAAEYQQRYGGPGTRAGALCAKLEAELAELSPEEAQEFRREMGAPAGATERVLELTQDLLGLVTFFTAGDKEARAWTLPAGSTALQAAGRVHTDIERGFIRAEVIAWDKLLEFGSHVEARRQGQLRTEGKQYIVQDGDVINILFNV